MLYKYSWVTYSYIFNIKLKINWQMFLINYIIIYAMLHI